MFVKQRLILSVALQCMVLLQACSGGGGESAPIPPTPSDTGAPVITLNGAATVRHEQGTTYRDAGATANDAVDGNVSVTTSGNVGDTAASYTLTYTANDSSGNSATATREVTVEDTVAPVVTVNGALSVEQLHRSVYVDEGATAQDTVDGAVNVDLTGSVVDALGTYTLTYTAIDSAGNSASIERTVEVCAAEPVEINGELDFAAACDAQSAISLVQEHTQAGLGGSWEVDYYVNSAYSCGLSGSQSFLIVEPRNNPGTEAPLWIFLHGGGVGYFDANQNYHTMKSASGPIFNDQETFDYLLNDTILSQVFDNSAAVIDSTIKRRLDEGYRVLVPSMCTHDLYSGLGTPYPNTANTDTKTNGLQATMAAIDYTVANFPTSDVFAHGASAGSAGVFPLALAYNQQNVNLTGIVLDSYLITPRLLPLFAAIAGHASFPFDAQFDPQAVIEKVGYFSDTAQYDAYPEAQISSGFRAVPILYIAGKQDSFCGGGAPAIADAVSAGFNNNCEWLIDGLSQSVAAQANSPHQVELINGGHVLTEEVSTANDAVDTFINRVLAESPPHPFS